MALPVILARYILCIVVIILFLLFNTLNHCLLLFLLDCGPNNCNNGACNTTNGNCDCIAGHFGPYCGESLITSSLIIINVIN